MEIEKYLRIISLIVLVSMYNMSCMVNDNSDNLNTTNETGLHVEQKLRSLENTQNFGGSVYIQVEAPEELTQVRATIRSEENDDALVYRLRKRGSIWEGIIGNLSAGYKKEACIRGFYKKPMLYIGKTNFEVVENNTVLLFVRFNEAASKPEDQSVIKSVQLNPYLVSPGETININLSAYSQIKNEELTFQWSAEYGSFDNWSTETPMWTAPEKVGIYDLTVTTKDSKNNFDYITFPVRVDSKYKDYYMQDMTKGTNSRCATIKPPCIKSINTTPEKFVQGKSVKISANVTNQDNCKLKYKWWTSCYQDNNCNEKYGYFNNTESNNPVFVVNSNAPLKKFKVNVKVCHVNNCSYASKIVQVYDVESINLAIKNVEAIPSAIKPGKSLLLDVFVEADSSDKLTYSWASSCPGTFNDASVKKPIFTSAPNLTADSCEIKVVVSNQCKQVSGSVSITIIKENSKPIINALIADKSEVQKNDVINLSVDAYDPDGDNLTYLWVSTCSGSFSNKTSKNTMFTISPNSNPGYCYINVQVEDGKAYATESKSILVVDFNNNNSPEILNMFVDPKEAYPGDSVDLTLDAIDLDGDLLAYEWTATCSGTFNDTTIENPFFTIDENSSQFGNCLFKVIVSDSESQTYGFLAFEILKPDTKPVINMLTADPTVLDHNEVTQLQLDVTDADGDALTYLWTTDCQGSFNDATLKNPEFTVSNNASYGNCLIKVKVSDGTNQVSGAIGIEIFETVVNEAPVVNSTFQTTDVVLSGGAIIFIIRANDPEGTALSFEWSADSGTFGVPIEIVTNDYTESFVVWTAPDCGVDPINIKVDITDGDGFSTENIYLPVTLIDGVICP